VEVPGGKRLVRIYDRCPILIPDNLEIGKDIECGEILTLDEDEQVSGAPGITFMRVRAKGDMASQPPVFFHEGGPGGSGETGVDVAALLRDTLGVDRDLVVVSQRGTRFSAAVPECEQEPLKGTETPEEKQRLTEESSAKCKARLERSGYKLTELSTQAAVSDVEALRKVFEYEQLDFYGISYGVTYAIELARQFPQTVRKLLLDSGSFYGSKDVNQHYVDRYTVPIEFAKNITQDLTNRCARMDCSGLFTERPDFALIMEQVLDVLSTREVSTPIGTLNFARMVSLYDPLHTYASYNTRIAFSFFAWGVVINDFAPARRTLHQVYGAGESVDKAFQPMWDEILRFMRPSPSTLSPQLSWIVLCVDFIGGLDGALMTDYLQTKQLNSSGVLYTTVRNRLLDAAAVCKPYRELYQEVSMSFRKPLDLNTPTLILNSRFDAASPMPSVRVTAAGLKSSRVVEFPCTHHATLPFDDKGIRDCTGPLMRSFFDGTDVATVNTSCVCK